jgi:murein DD-endopeptidase MepM/ murein hydrolase activator NlpD
VFRAVISLALFAAVGSVLGIEHPNADRPLIARHARRPQDERARCPAGTLPDANVCVPVPDLLLEQGAALVAEHNAHRTRQGIWTQYDEIPRRPERPSNYRLYRYPIETSAAADFLISGFDLDLPDADQRRGEKLHAVGHGGVDLAAQRGAPVRLLDLENQQGDADVIYVGPLMGNTVVTRHAVQQAGALREYLVFYGHLQAPASNLSRGRVVPEGSVLGYVGDSGSPGLVHLHLEIRQVRSGVDSQSLETGELLLNARTIACDPRNLLPLR